MPTLHPEESTLYSSVADRVAGLIDKGTLRPGQKVPSVRKLSAQLDVSISTVLQAYRLLEDRGRIEARPQSGYYVRGPLAPPPAEPRVLTCRHAPCKVSVMDVVARLLTFSNAPGTINLGGALPGEAGMPTQQLNRLSAAIARRTKRGNNTYDLPPGCPELRAQVARRYVDAGCALAPDDILTTCGCQEALNLCVRAVARAGDAIAIESPTFYGHLQTIETLGMRALEIPTSPRDGISIEALGDALVRQRGKIRAVVVISNCQNPLGSVMPEERKRELVRLLARHEVPLIEDDIYGDLAFDRARPGLCKSHDQDGNVLLCSSFSKTLAPGARVGWCAPGKYLRDVLRLKIGSTLATPTLPQLAIAQFLATGHYEHHLRKTRALYAHQVQQVSAAVQRYFPAGTRVTRPAGGFVVWVELPEGTDAMALHEKAIARGISVAPGPIFSAKGKFENFIRLNCSCPWTPELERALMTLGELAGEG